MLSNWLAVLSEDNWEICAREGLLGFGRKSERRLNQMQDGDRVWVYINKKHVDKKTPRIMSIRALATIAGPLHRLSKPPWHPRGDQTFDLARAITVQQTFDLPAEVLLREMLSTRWGGWSAQLLRTPLFLDDQDTATLEEALTNSGYPSPTSRGR
jgi:hypothetical protein